MAGRSFACNTWESAGGSPPSPGTTGLYHFAINYPTRRDLAVALKRLLDGGWNIDGSSDHLTHEAIYLHDPDMNGIELAWDRDESEWPRHGDRLTFGNRPLDFKGLMGTLEEPVQALRLAVRPASVDNGATEGGGAWRSS